MASFTAPALYIHGSQVGTLATVSEGDGLVDLGESMMVVQELSTLAKFVRA